MPAHVYDSWCTIRPLHRRPLCDTILCRFLNLCFTLSSGRTQLLYSMFAWCPFLTLSRDLPPPPPLKAAKRAARQEKFGYMNPDAEKKAKVAAKVAWLASEQAEKKAKRIARFGGDTTAVAAAPKSTTPQQSSGKKGGSGGGRSGRGSGGARGGGRERGGRNGRQSGGGGDRGRGGGPVSATAMLSQGLKSSR